MKKFFNKSENTLFIGCMIFLSFGTFGPSFAQNTTIVLGSEQYELVKINSECAIYQPTSQVYAAKQAAAHGFRYFRAWQGSCVNGLVEGLGIYTETTEYPMAVSVFSPQKAENSRNVHQYTSRMRAGIPLGYSKHQFSSTGLPSKTDWRYQYGSNKVSIDGMGLFITDENVSSEVIRAPISKEIALSDAANGSLVPRTIEGLEGLSAQLKVRAQTCAVWFLKSQFPECGFEQGKNNFEVYYLIRNDENNREVTPDFQLCPRPKSVSSCNKIAQAAADNLRMEIVDFIETTKSSVEADIQKSIKIIRAGR